ncbi:MAG: TIGR03435 family protein [Planctomycetota bacterium]
MHTSALAVALVSFTALLAQDPLPLKIGSAAPPLSVAKWLDGNAAFELGKGRACMLVFWAPWCGSCIAEFPRINELIAASKDLTIEFVAITSEPQGKVEALLASRPLHARAALDDDGKSFKAFGVRVLPRLVLVDAKGAVAALPRLEAIDRDVLTKLAAGEALDLPEAKMQPCDLEWDENKQALDADASLGHVWIERSQSSSGGVRFPPGHGRITADGVGFANLIQIAYGAEPHEVQSSHPSSKDREQRYRISVKAPDDQPGTAREMLREHLQHLFEFRAEWTETEEPTAVLRRVPGKELQNLSPSHEEKSSGMARSGAVQFKKVAIDRIVQTIGSFAYGKAMIDETGLQGEYDVNLEWTPGDKQSFEKALADCGLQVSKEPRKVRKLKVEPR